MDNKKTKIRIFYQDELKKDIEFVAKCINETTITLQNLVLRKSTYIERIDKCKELNIYTTKYLEAILTDDERKIKDAMNGLQNKYNEYKNI